MVRILPIRSAPGIEDPPKPRRRCRRPRRSILSLPTLVRDEIWSTVIHSTAKVKIEELPSAPDSSKGAETFPTFPARHSLAVPWLGAVLANKQCKEEVAKPLKRHKLRVMTVEGLWLRSTLPRFFADCGITRASADVVCSARRLSLPITSYIKAIVLRTSEATTSPANDLRLGGTIMKEYKTRTLQSLPAVVRIQLAVAAHEAFVEGELRVDTRRVLLFVVHRLVLR